MCSEKETLNIKNQEKKERNIRRNLLLFANIFNINNNNNSNNNKIKEKTLNAFIKQHMKEEILNLTKKPEI